MQKIREHLGNMEIAKEIEKANKRLSKVSIRQKRNSFYCRGTFPPKKGDGEKKKQYEIKLECKANELKKAIARAMKIESQLILGEWQWQDETSPNSVEMMVKDFTEKYWKTHQPTRNRLYIFRMTYQRIFDYLPADEMLTKALIIKAIESKPIESYARKDMITYLRPLAKFAGIKIDFTQFGKYKEKRGKKLPRIETIIDIYKREKNLRNKWFIGIFFTFGLRPHEIFKSTFFFDKYPQTVEVWETTKTGVRTVYPLIHPEIDVFNLPIPELKSDLSLPNTRLGHQISKRFTQYPFTVYELRTYYAVRCAENNIGIVTASKWMGHTTQVHTKSYASYLSDIESQNIWMQKFG